MKEITKASTSVGLLLATAVQMLHFPFLFIKTNLKCKHIHGKLYNGSWAKRQASRYNKLKVYLSDSILSVGSHVFDDNLSEMSEFSKMLCSADN